MSNSSPRELDTDSFGSTSTETQSRTGSVTPEHPNTDNACKECIDALQQLQLDRDSSLQYWALWDTTIQQSTAEKTVPEFQGGECNPNIAYSVRVHCLQQACKPPHKPFLLADQSQQPTVAQLASWRIETGTAPRNGWLLELHFSAGTKLELVQQVIQTTMERLHQNEWHPTSLESWSSKRTSRDQNDTSESIQSSVDTTGLASSNRDSEWIGFCRRIHGSLEPEETDQIVSSELQKQLQVDRVWVARKVRGIFRPTAVSGQATVNFRSPHVLAMSDLLPAILATRQWFTFPRETNLPAEIREPLDRYLILSETRAIAVAPIFSNSSPTPRQQEGQPDANPNEVVAAIVIESLNQHREFAQEVDTPQALQLASDAIQRSYQHSRLFLYPLWRRLGSWKAVVWSRRLPFSALLLTLAAALLVLLLWPASFYVSAPGQLIPVSRARVFAPLNGIVEEVYVASGQTVKKGQPLLRLRDYELETQLQSTQRELAVIDQQIRIQNLRIRTGADEDRFLTREEETPISVLEEERNNLLLQEQLLMRQRDLMLITSPIDGTVIGWQLEENLLQRPVGYGRFLLEIANSQEPWQLELHLPDRRVGHLLNHIHRSPEPARVEYILAAQPEQRHWGTVRNVSQTTDSSQDEGAFVRVMVKIDRPDLTLSQNQTEVSAKIYCGSASLGYIWLHDIEEFFQKKVFFFTW